MGHMSSLSQCQLFSLDRMAEYVLTPPPRIFYKVINESGVNDLSNMRGQHVRYPFISYELLGVYEATMRLSLW